MADPSFSCLALLENEICFLYEVLVDRAENIQVKLLLDLILQESRAHRELFERLSELFARYESGPSLNQCGKEMGELFMQALKATRSVRDRVLGGMPVMEAARLLLKVEENAGEEQLTEMHSEIRALEASNSAVKRILHDIAEDEKSHVEILKQVIEIASN